MYQFGFIYPNIIIVTIIFYIIVASFFTSTTAPPDIRAREATSWAIKQFSSSAIDQTCMAYVKQIIFSFSAGEPACNPPAVSRRQVTGRSKWILPHQRLSELSAPIRSYEARVRLSWKDDNRLLRKLINSWRRRKKYEFSRTCSPPPFTLSLISSTAGQSCNWNTPIKLTRDGTAAIKCIEYLNYCLFISTDQIYMSRYTFKLIKKNVQEML